MKQAEDAAESGPTRHQRRGLRRVLMGIAGVALLVAIFVFMHSGARATDVCGERGLARASPSPSLFPPGARCVGGTESPEVVKFDAGFLLVAPTVYLVFGLIALSADRVRRRGRGHRLSS